MSAAGADETWTEARLLDMLRERHAKSGNGGAGEWAFLTHVRDAASFDASRTLDALAVSLWPSRGFEMHGFEVKTSRSDLLRELADPAKAEVWHERLDRFWLVAAPGVVRADDVPLSWGLMVPTARGLTVKRAAPLLHPNRDAPPISRSWLVCLLRAVGAVPVPDAVLLAAARNEGHREATQAHNAEREAMRERLDGLRQEAQDAQDAMAEVTTVLGSSARTWRQTNPEHARAVAAVLRVLLAEDYDGWDRLAADVEHAAEMLGTHAAGFRETATELRAALAARVSD